MSIGFSSNFSNFQSCLAQAAAALEGSRAATALSEIQSLPDWRSPELRPQTLGDLSQGERSLACWFNTSLGASVCRILGVNPRDAYQREIRSERMLPALIVSNDVRTIEMDEQPDVSRAVVAMMRDQGTTVLSGIFHVVSQRIFIGSSTLSHMEIALSQKIWEESEYARISFGLRNGALYAFWPVAHETEALGARKMIERLLSPIFAGLPIPA